MFDLEAGRMSWDAYWALVFVSLSLHLLPSSLAHLPPPTHPPYSRMIFPSTSPSMVFLCLEKKEEKLDWFPCCLGKKLEALA